ncbi:hypothetical protein [Sporomusa aerivorans]|uniref:hypothetical protein n=1 Tax=Sporomusa aerivorans TaxID=204936 RepID=UPI00352BC059
MSRDCEVYKIAGSDGSQAGAACCKSRRIKSSLIDRAAPPSANQTATALCPAVRSLRRSAILIRSRPATAGAQSRILPSGHSSAWQGSRPGHSLVLVPGLQETSAGPAHCAGPRQATPAGPAETPPADPAGRPADRRERQPDTPGLWATNRSTGPPATTRLAG